MTVPCQPYITHNELAICCEEVSAMSGGDDPLDELSLWSRQVASSFLFYATGQQFPGTCTVNLRPSYECSPCYDRPRATLIGGHVYNLRCNRIACGCSDRARITLSGRDIQSVDAIYFNGEPLDPTDFHVLGRNTIVLRAGLEFPECQEWGNPAFPDLEPLLPVSAFANTWGATVTTGAPVPGILKQAAVDLACHFQNVCEGGCNTCRSAIGFSTNDGNIDLAFQDVLPHVFTGIASVDFAVKSLNPDGYGKTQARIWSPEAQKTYAEYGG